MTLARQLIGDAFIDQIDVKIHRQHQRKHNRGHTSRISAKRLVG